MLRESYLFVSKQTTEYPYLYLEIPFDNNDRTLVHAIDHIHAQRLEDLSFINHVHCETFSGTNTYAIEVQFNRELTSEMLAELDQILWQQPLEKGEVSAALATTQLEGLRNFYKRKNMFAQLRDHRVSNETELLEAYRSISAINFTQVQAVWEEMNRAPKIVIAHVQKNLTFKRELEKLLVSNPVGSESSDVLKLPELLIDDDLKDTDFVHVEMVYELSLKNMLEYQKAALLFNIYQEVLYRQLFRLGLVYDFTLLVNEGVDGTTFLVLEFDCFNKSVHQIQGLASKTLSTSLEKLKVEEQMIGDVLESAHDEVHAWRENELERDFNHAWQIIVFGKEAYRKLETVEAFLEETSLQKVQQYRDRLGNLLPNHVVIVKY